VTIEAAWRIVALAALLNPTPLVARAHVGHTEAPGSTSAATASQTVEVTAEARRNLGLEVVEVAMAPISSTLSLIGEIAAMPDRSGAITSRIAGRVASVAVAEGDTVRRGQPVIEVESLLLGDPPPRVSYVSPLDGVVTDRHIVRGDSVEPNAHLLEVADLREVLAVGRLFEGQIGGVAVGQIVRVGVPGFPDRTFDGTVERLGGSLDLDTRSLPVYVRVRNPSGDLRPGMRAELAIETQVSSAALVAPRSAVLGDFGALFVFREKGEEATRFERVPVVTGVRDDRRIEIVEGLLPGDRIAAQGNYPLQFLPAIPDDGQADEPAHEEAAVPRADGAILGALGLGVIALAATSAIVVIITRTRRRRT
jgi:multidrug efflux pump subunit AcrA (membrane-fusion protein)